MSSGFSDLYEEVLNQDGRVTKWDKRFLRLARFWANECSKDPSTKVGAVIVSPDRSSVHLGYNGFPRGVKDAEERYADRPTKYGMVVHAELNAILTAREPLTGWTVYTWPLLTCNECAKAVIQSGIVRVVSVEVAHDRWNSSFDIALRMYEEAGVRVRLYPDID